MPVERLDWCFAAASTSKPPGSENGEDPRPLALVEVAPDGEPFKYPVPVTSLASSQALAQFYRDRADAENAFEELNSHRGWGDSTTRDPARCRWWHGRWSTTGGLFARLTDPDRNAQATTSRRLLLHVVAGPQGVIAMKLSMVFALPFSMVVMPTGPLAICLIPKVFSPPKDTSGSSGNIQFL